MPRQGWQGRLCATLRSDYVFTDVSLRLLHSVELDHPCQVSRSQPTCLTTASAVAMGARLEVNGTSAPRLVPRDELDTSFNLDGEKPVLSQVSVRRAQRRTAE